MEENLQTNEKKSKNGLIVGVLLALMVVAIPFLLLSNKGDNEKLQSPAAAVGSNLSQDDSMPTETPMVSSAQSSEAPVDVVNGAITIEAGSFYYKPNLIRVKKGQKVTVTLNSVSMMHDFYLDEFAVKGPITKSGESSKVTFTADKVGQFEFYCSVGQHRANGQVGKLIVTD